MTRGVYYESAEAHLKDFLPRIYRQLIDLGKLEEHLGDVQERTGRLLLQLIEGGLNYSEARVFIDETVYVPPIVENAQFFIAPGNTGNIENADVSRKREQHGKCEKRRVSKSDTRTLDLFSDDELPPV